MAYQKLDKLRTDSLSLYLKEIAKIPQIDPDREKVLGKRIQEHGDEDALNELVTANLRFVVSFAKKYRNGPLTFADLIEEGNIGLIEAAKRFDPEKGVKFITYAAWWIRQSIIHALGEQGRTIRLPQRQANLLYQLGKQYNELKNALHRRPTTAEVAEEMDIPREQAEHLMRYRKDDLSLDQTYDDDDKLSLADMLPEDDTPVDIELIRQNFADQMREVLLELKPRERLVIKERFGLNENEEPKTLQSIGEDLGITRERVRQIEQQAIKKLRRNSQCRKLQTFLN